MDHSKPQYLTPTGFSRSPQKRKGLSGSSRKLPSHVLKKFSQNKKPFQLSEEAAQQIARVISQMLKSK